jgi:pseudouridine-5'-phosphate glycosidase
LLNFRQKLSRFEHMQKANFLKITSEVESALVEGRPVVALESTVIAHGLPRPINLETARNVESIVREAGAIPATIAVLDGWLRVGLTPEELEFIGTNPNVKKLSTRDLPIALAENWNGATTVATTSWIADMAGIRVFATGGIGGVHRGDLPDISADLPQLARTNMIVACSGGKIVLDLDATREWLETNGITVVGFGCDSMPAFYSRESHLPVDVQVDSPGQAAAIASARWAIGLQGATLVTVPVPVEAEVPNEILAAVLDETLREAVEQKIMGRELTPFLLTRMSEHSGGATLKANIALLENNARVAAKIAIAITDQVADTHELA